MSLWDVTARAGETKAILEFQGRRACFLLRFLSWKDVSTGLVLCGRKLPDIETRQRKAELRSRERARQTLNTADDMILMPGASLA